MPEKGSTLRLAPHHQLELMAASLAAEYADFGIVARLGFNKIHFGATTALRHLG
jgi:hypothetical protein